MADTIELTGTLEDYRSKVAELNEALDQLDSSSQEYSNTLSELQSLNQQYAETCGFSIENTQQLTNNFSELSQKVTDASTELEETKTKTDELGESSNKTSDLIDKDLQKLANTVGILPGPINTVLNVWKSFQAVMMSNPWIAVLTIALGALIAIFKTFKNAIDNNEQTSMKWKKAMSTLQPVINGVKNFIDKLATAFVNMTEWVMSRLPGVVRIVGKSAASVVNFVADLVDAWNKFPIEMDKIWGHVLNAAYDAWNALMSKIASGLRAIKLDDWANSIENSIKNFAAYNKEYWNGINRDLATYKNGSKEIRNAANSIIEWTENAAVSMEKSRKLQQQKNELDKDARDLNEALAASYSRTADARNKLNEARAKGNYEEALKYEKQMEEEAYLRAEKTLVVQKKQQDYMESMAKLTANSAKVNDALSQQRVKIINTETRASQELIQATRQRIKLEKDLERAQAKKDKAAEAASKKALSEARKAEKAAEAARKKELAEAEKAANLADKEARDKSKETIKQYNEQIAAYEAEYNEFKGLEERKLKLLEQLNIVTKKDRQNYEQERYKEEMEMHKKTIDSYLKLIDDANVLEADKNKYRIKLNEAFADQMMAKIQHDINMAKIDADELNKLTNELQTKLKTETQRLSTEEQNRYNQELINLTERYKKGEISNKQYLDRLEEIRRQHNENINNINIDQARREAENAKVIYDQMVQNVQDRYKDLGKIVADSEKELNNIIEEEQSKDADDRDDERIRKAEQTYATLKAIYEEGENGINNVINMLFKARSEMQSGGLDDSTNNMLQPIFDAFKIDGEELAAGVDTALKMVAEVLGINLDDMLAKWQDYYAKKSEADTKANEDSANNLKNSANNAIKESDRQLKQFDKLSKQMSKTMSAVSNYWEQSIEQRLEAGEISQEQAEEEFERLKKFNIAQAVVDTISGALSAYMSVWKSPSLDLWAKIAMSVLMGAQTLASGYAQIRQIQSQTLSGASAGGSSSTNVIVGAATPILSEAQDINNLNAMNAATEQDPSNTRVYVVESDITEAQNKTRVRVQESTF